MSRLRSAATVEVVVFALGREQIRPFQSLRLGLGDRLEKRLFGGRPDAWRRYASRRGHSPPQAAKGATRNLLLDLAICLLTFVHVLRGRRAA